jgi:hypothetical protein
MITPAAALEASPSCVALLMLTASSRVYVFWQLEQQPFVLLT